jgi:Arylsulfotransferase (ASST)
VLPLIVAGTLMALVAGVRARSGNNAGSRLGHWRSAGAAAIVVSSAIALTCVSACSVARPGAMAPCGAPPPGAADHAPPVTVLTGAATSGSGDIFIAPQGCGYGSGPEIVSSTGKVIWFHALPQGEFATDFRTQTYQGKPVLTWFQGSGLTGTDYIYDDRYQQIAAVRASIGYDTDFHEFLITPWNTALILADTFATANLTSMGGPANQKVFDGIVEEVDIRTGRVLFRWDSAGHVPYRDSHLPLPASPATPWDWFHINAVHLDTDGNLLINSRYTWTTYKVNRHTGNIIWELGGKQSTFRLRAAPGESLDTAGEIFAFQHDPEAIGNGEYTFFDDESDGPTTLLPHSRVVTVKLNLATRVATLVKSVGQPDGLVASAEGNAQTLPDGGLFVGWGTLPYISQFSPSGRLLFNAVLPPGVHTYRAYRLPWHPAS